jgi:pimeloyl-ACP methyl ester carboxylesterase
MYVSRPGARIFYQVTGSAEHDVVLLPPCYPVVHSRTWKMQVPYLSRTFRVVTTDFRGNGRSDRPATGYEFDTLYGDVCAVLDEAARPPFALVGYSCSNMLTIRYAVEHPERLSHLILLSSQYSQPLPEPFDEKYAPLVRDDFSGYLRRFFTSLYPEPHSLKGIEDGIGWGGETTAEVLVEALREIRKDNVRDLLAKITTPTLVLHGTRDRIVPYKVGVEIAETIPGARFVTFEAGGHGLPGREAVNVNRLIRDFVLDHPVASQTIPPTTERPTAKPPPWVYTIARELSAPTGSAQMASTPPRRSLL